MPLDPILPRGVAPLGADLAHTMQQVAQLRRQDANTAEFSRRTDLFEQNAQREALSAEFATDWAARLSRSPHAHYAMRADWLEWEARRPASRRDRNRETPGR